MKGEKEVYTIIEGSQGYEGMAEIRSERTLGFKKPRRFPAQVRC
jgi:hypothetical protein